MLGALYAGGTGVKEDSKQAVIWVTKAAKNGYKDAQEMLKKLQGDSKSSQGSDDSKSDDAGSDE